MRNVILTVSFFSMAAVIFVGYHFKKQLELEKMKTSQQDRISELEKAKEEEQKMEQEKIAKEEKEKEDAEILKNEQAAQEADLNSCKSIQSSCSGKINSISSKIYIANNYIKSREHDIKTRNDIIDDCENDACKKPYEDAIDAHKKLIKEKEEEIKELEKEQAQLIAGECRNYKNPCSAN